MMSISVSGRTVASRARNASIEVPAARSRNASHVSSRPSLAFRCRAVEHHHPFKRRRTVCGQHGRIRIAEEGAAAEQQPRAAVLENRRGFQALHARIDRHQRRARAVNRERRHDPFRDVRRPDRDTLARLDAAAHQRARRFDSRGVQLRIAQVALGCFDRDARAEARGAARDQRGRRQDVVERHDEFDGWGSRQAQHARAARANREPSRGKPRAASRWRVSHYRPASSRRSDRPHRARGWRSGSRCRPRPGTCRRRTNRCGTSSGPARRRAASRRAGFRRFRR